MKAELSELTPAQYRVQRAKLAIAAHTGDEYPENKPIASMVDLIADLLHLADDLHLDFAQCERMARGRYREEKS